MSADRELVFCGRRMVFDEHGYLGDPDAWSEDLAAYLAASDGIALSSAHWEVLRYLRDYHAEYGLAPPMRLLVRELASRIGGDGRSSRTLYRLFPNGPVQQASRYAGLPRPLNCI